MEHSGASGKPSQGIQSRVLFDLTDISKGRFTRHNFTGMRQAYDKPTTRTVSCKCCRVRHKKFRGILKHVFKRCDNRSRNL